MKLGLMTAAFPRLNLDRIAARSAENGFETLEIACWPRSGGQRRRYAGVCHIDAQMAPTFSRMMDRSECGQLLCRGAGAQA